MVILRVIETGENHGAIMLAAKTICQEALRGNVDSVTRKLPINVRIQSSDEELTLS